MRTFKLFAMILSIGIIAVSCKKEAGPTGPQGAAGTNGTNGNANVKVYGYSITTLSSTNSYYANFYPAGLTGGMIDSSLIVVYYAADQFSWNVANGLGPAGNYATIQYTDNTPPASVNVYLRNANGTAYTGADVVWDSVRVFIIPANIFKHSQHNKLDYSNYKAVNDYYRTK